MNLLKSFEFIPGVKWFESEMHDSLFQHSVFGAIVFLIVSHTDVYKFVGKMIEVKDKNVLMLVHSVVFAIIMYFGSMYLFAPLLAEGYEGDDSLNGNTLSSDPSDTSSGRSPSVCAQAGLLLTPQETWINDKRPGMDGCIPLDQCNELLDAKEINGECRGYPHTPDGIEAAQAECVDSGGRWFPGQGHDPYPGRCECDPPKDSETTLVTDSCDGGEPEVPIIPAGPEQPSDDPDQGPGAIVGPGGTRKISDAQRDCESQPGQHWMESPFGVGRCVNNAICKPGSSIPVVCPDGKTTCDGSKTHPPQCCPGLNGGPPTTCPSYKGNHAAPECAHKVTDCTVGYTPTGADVDPNCILEKEDEGMGFEDAVKACLNLERTSRTRKGRNGRRNGSAPIGP